MAEAPKLAVVGSETLIGREVRELVAASDLPFDLKLIAEDESESGKLTESAGEPALVWGLNVENLQDAAAVFLAGSPESAHRALDLGIGAHLIDLTHAVEDSPRARLRAPRLEPPGYAVPRDAVHVIAHPASVAIAALFESFQAQYPVRRSLVHVFEPASERGSRGIDELQRQTVGLLSFKSMPKEIFAEQLSFNLLARYGEDAPVSLEQVELRIERDLATLLSFVPGACPPMPSLRLIQAPVFHGYSFSVWVEFEDNPGTEALESRLQSAGMDVRGSELDPPHNVGIAGQGEIAVGAVALDRNAPQACWIWMVADNLRLTADNAVAVARQLL
ncbi:MAG TPA: Asd/ArgC dimerization domain-containing protein [Bryobacteraceae bacterium]|nr:Asd/ArgC dimerization domain-containing protein [Bryobacteraceae bacterium]